VVYFKMLLVGFFENLASERGIAARCADSLSIRQFLHYDLTEATPDHSSLSVIRGRLDAEVFQDEGQAHWAYEDRGSRMERIPGGLASIFHPPDDRRTSLTSSGQEHH